MHVLLCQTLLSCLTGMTNANKLMQVEAGLSDLRQAYAELHEQLDAKQEEKPPEEQQRIRQHVSITLNMACAPFAQFLCVSQPTLVDTLKQDGAASTSWHLWLW